MIAILFLVMLGLSFTPLYLAMRPSAGEQALKRRIISVRVGGISDASGAPLLDLSEPETSTLVARIGAIAAKYRFASALERLILHAGSEASVGGVLLLSVALAGILGCLVLLFVGLPPVAGAAALLGAVLPTMSLRFRKGRRLKKFTAALPEAVDLMARSLRAGHAVGASIEIVAEQGAEPLAGEFARVFQQQRFGMRFRDALLEMAERVPSPDLHFLITAILVQRETGGDLPDILDRTTEVIRERVRIQGEVKVHTAQGRLTGWILSGLPVVLLLVINVLSPGYSKVLFDDPTGNKLLYAGGGCIILGTLIINKIVAIKV